MNGVWICTAHVNLRKPSGTFSPLISTAGGLLSKPNLWAPHFLRLGVVDTTWIQMKTQRMSGKERKNRTCLVWNSFFQHEVFTVFFEPDCTADLLCLPGGITGDVHIV